MPNPKVTRKFETSLKKLAINKHSSLVWPPLATKKKVSQQSTPRSNPLKLFWHKLRQYLRNFSRNVKYFCRYCCKLRQKSFK